MQKFCAPSCLLEYDMICFSSRPKTAMRLLTTLSNHPSPSLRAMRSKIHSFREGAKSTDLTERGKPNHIAHGSITIFEFPRYDTGRTIPGRGREGSY